MNIIMDDTLIFFDEDEQSEHTQADPSEIATRSALWFVKIGRKIFKRGKVERNTQNLCM